MGARAKMTDDLRTLLHEIENGGYPNMQFGGVVLVGESDKIPAEIIMLGLADSNSKALVHLRAKLMEIPAAYFRAVAVAETSASD